MESNNLPGLMSLKSSVGDTDVNFIEGKISEALVTIDNSNCQ